MNLDGSDARDLENRLLDFAVALVGIVEALTESKAGNHMGGQFIRSGTSPAPNYGEAQSAESRKDFVHKMKISLKELRETMVWLKIIDRKSLAPRNEVVRALSECNELIAIFVATTKTADANGKIPFKNQKSTIDTSNCKYGQPRPTSNQEPRTKNQEPRTKNQEPRTKNQDCPLGLEISAFGRFLP